jgi:hypothetical protein
MKDQIITTDDDLIDRSVEVEANVRGDISSFYMNEWQDWSRKWKTRANMVVYSNGECTLTDVADFRLLSSDCRIGWTDLINVISHLICLTSKCVWKYVHFDGFGLQAVYSSSIIRMIRSLLCDVSTWRRWQHWDPYRSCCHSQDQGYMLLVGHVLRSQQEFYGFYGPSVKRMTSSNREGVVLWKDDAPGN